MSSRQPSKLYEVKAEHLQEAVNGICLSCGTIQHGGVEPDARNHTCRLRPPSWLGASPSSSDGATGSPQPENC